jgi:ribonucleotide monophosphatase NagD (HAD superfamily)
VTEDQVITSGSLLGPYFEQEGLRGLECAVLGPEDSRAYVREAGGVVVDVFDLDPKSVGALIIGDESGFPFLAGVDAALTLAIQKLDAQAPLRLILPNPDLIYPKRNHAFGFASGTIALMIESALKIRYPGLRDTSFVRLGKPHHALFEEAVRRSGSHNVVMIGDQLETDVRGAKAFGLDTVLVSTGVTFGRSGFAPEIEPTFEVSSLV